METQRYPLVFVTMSMMWVMSIEIWGVDPIWKLGKHMWFFVWNLLSSIHMGRSPVLVYRWGVWRKKRTNKNSLLSGCQDLMATSILVIRSMVGEDRHENWLDIRITLWSDRRGNDSIDPYDLVAVVWWDAPVVLQFISDSWKCEEYIGLEVG